MNWGATAGERGFAYAITIIVRRYTPQGEQVPVPSSQEIELRFRSSYRSLHQVCRRP